MTRSRNGSVASNSRRKPARGQTIVAKAELFSIRDDVEGAATAKAVNEKIGATARPIPVSNELLGTLEQSKRLEFLNKWQASQKK